MEFHETRMGHKFFEGDIPKLIHTLERVAQALETNATLAEQKPTKIYALFTADSRCQSSPGLLGVFSSEAKLAEYGVWLCSHDNYYREHPRNLSVQVFLLDELKGDGSEGECHLLVENAADTSNDAPTKETKSEPTYYWFQEHNANGQLIDEDKMCCWTEEAAIEKARTQKNWDKVINDVTCEVIWKREWDDEEVKFDSTLPEKVCANIDMPVAKPNTDLLCAARKAAGQWQNCEGYEQAADIITMLADEVEKLYKLSGIE